MLKPDIIVIGASAGGVETLTQLVNKLPPDLPATLFVTLHFPSNTTSFLPQILNRRGHLQAVHARDQEVIRQGMIYVSPPDYHLIVEPEQIHLSHGPRENGFRPAIDTMFRSAARSYKHRVIGVILSGSLDDGTVGLAVIKSCGGITIVQEPNEALFEGMPRNAIERVEIDHVLKVSEIASMLIQLTDGSIPKENTMPHEMAKDSEIVAQHKADLEQGKHIESASSMLTCPDCGGVLWELQEGNLLRYRCHVGHAYSVDSLLQQQGDDVERALWSAVRALEEKAALARRMATQARKHNRTMSENQFMKRSQEAEEQAALVRQVILQQQIETT